MEILYQDKKVEKILNDINLLKKKVDLQFVKAIIKRLQQIESVDTVEVLMNSGLDKPHFLYGDMEGCIAMSITKNYRLILKCYFDEINTIKDALKLTKIIVLGVDDYHGGKHTWLIP